MRILRNRGPSLPSPSSFRIGLGLPASFLLDFSETNWVTWPHGMKVSAMEGDTYCGFMPSSNVLIINQYHLAMES